MTTTLLLNIAQILVTLLLVMSILLQQRGSGLGGAFGGSGGVYRSKRGVERVLFNSTIVFAILFVVVALLNATLR